MAEQLYIERERFDKLTAYIIADNTTDIDQTEIEEMEEIQERNNMSWSAQKTRMINRARLEAEQRKKENKES